MSSVNLGGNPITIGGEFPQKGNKAPAFKLVAKDLSDATLATYSGKRKVLNIFPSIDTPTCATSVQRFNKEATKLDNTVVLCVSRDLPFAQKRFCGAEGLDNVVPASDFRNGEFGRTYGVQIEDGPLAGLLARSVVVIDESGTVVHSQLVGETADEPDYDAAISKLR